MRILIAGGSGSIGQALTQSLIKDGHTVTILSRKPQPPAKSSTGVSILHWDGVTTSGWGHIINDIDAVINLTGENIGAGRWTKKRKQLILESRDKPGRALSAAIQQAKSKPGILLQVSGVGSYGASESQIFDEESAYGDDFAAGVCKVWEASTKAVETVGVRRIVVRLAVVLDKKTGALPRMLLPFRFFVGGPLGTGRQWFSWIHMQDAIRAIRYLIETPRGQGTYNVSANPVTNLQFAKTLGKVLHRPSFIPVPSFAIKLLFGEMGTVILDGQRVSTKRLEDLGFHFMFPNIGNALEQLFGKK